MFKKIFKKKIIIPFLLLLILSGYFGYKALKGNEKEIRYVLSAVEKGTLILSVSGSGQVSVSDQVDIKPKVSSEVTALYVKTGDEVKKGQLIARLDDTDFKKSVSDAEISFETVKLELEELLSPPDGLTLLQAENTLTKARESKTKAEQGIKNGLEDSFNSITNIFFDLPTIIATARDVLYSYDIGKSEITLSNYEQNISVYENSFEPVDRTDLQSFIIKAESDYKAARLKYDKNFKNYKNTTYYSESETIENLLNETAETVRAMSQAVKSEINLLDFVADYFSSHDRRLYDKISAYRTNLQSYYSKTNSYFQNLYSIQNSLKDDRQAVIDAELSVREKELSLENLKAGADELTIRAKKLAVQQKEDALIAAKQNLANCYITAPFDGIVTDIKVKKDDSVSAGTVLANIITQQKIAEITFNEIDAANIKVDQRATLTFDALPDVSITGKVIEVDAVGQVSQGVVSYGVKIAFDTDVEQVKLGMSVTADIIIEAKPDVLVLPNSAIKSQGNSYYVELVEVSEEMRQQLLASVSGTILPISPKLQLIEIGLASDFSTEIVAGLQEGDVVVSSMINPSAAQTTQTSRTTQTGGFQIPGINTGSGAQMRNFSR